MKNWKRVKVWKVFIIKKFAMAISHQPHYGLFLHCAPFSVSSSSFKEV
jgi:hypothetical protein